MIAASITAILLVLGLIKIELIKVYVKKVTGGKYSLVFTILAILIVSVIPIIVSYSLPAEEIVSNEIEADITESQSDTEVIIDFVGELGSDLIENKRIKDSIYEATREEKWVYKIGDVVADEELLFDLYNEVKDLGKVSFFKTAERNYFLFVDRNWGKNVLEDSLASFLNSIVEFNVKVTITDLVADCSRKEQLVFGRQIKMGKRKNKVLIPCYSCDK